MTTNTPQPPLTTRQRTLFHNLLSSFLTEGFEFFTIDGATKRFYCSKSTLYALGSSRDDIIRRILISFFKEVTRRTEAALKFHRSPKAALEQYFLAISAALKPASPAFMRDLARKPVAREIYQTNTTAATKIISNLIAQGAASGEFSTESPAFIAALITNAMEGIQLGTYADFVSAPQAYEQLGKLLIQGLTPQDP